MQTTVFSHIVQKRLSRENEDVATEALAYILGYSKTARNGMMKLLRGVVSSMPDLRFQTQQTEDNKRPDMWGYDKADPRVFIENKFWANLTFNQPVPYLELLAKCKEPTVLLFVVPEARVQMMWRELTRKLGTDIGSIPDRDDVCSIAYSVTTNIGPILALTSWTKLLDALESESKEEQRTRSDLDQLRALCKAADTDVPITAEEVSDQRTPKFLLQLGSIVKESVDKAEREDSLFRGRLTQGRDWERIGFYRKFSGEQGAGVWIGIEFELWKVYGGTPLWAVFSVDWGRAREVRELLEQWAREHGVFATSHEDDSFVVAIDIPFGEEKDQVVKAIANHFKEIARVLSKLKSKPVRS